MRPVRRRRTLSAAAVLSVVVHLGLIAALATYAPRLIVPREPAGPPQAVIPVLIMPRAPPPVAGGPARPTAIRLHRRAQRFAPAESPIPPLVVPEAPAEKTAPAPAPRAVTAPSTPDPLATNARQALRGVVGCANADALGLSREEREKCNDKLGAGARQAAFPGLGLEPDKAGDLARAGARKEADYRFKRAPPSPNSAPGAGRAGVSAEELGKSLGNDRPTATVPF
jgi:hypothetical protein